MRKANLEQITNAIMNFNLEGTVRSVTPYGNGHINDTFLVTCYGDDDSKHEYILQAVNNDVFKLPAQVMENIVKVTDYLIGQVLRLFVPSQAVSIIKIRTASSGVCMTLLRILSALTVPKI